jgi:hypothetical protein
MNYESLEIVELGRAEDLVEIAEPADKQEPIEKFSIACAPYVEFSE